MRKRTSALIVRLALSMFLFLLTGLNFVFAGSNFAFVGWDVLIPSIMLFVATLAVLIWPVYTERYTVIEGRPEDGIYSRPVVINGTVGWGVFMPIHFVWRVLIGLVIIGLVVGAVLIRMVV